MKDWLNDYSKPQKFQQGGAMVDPAAQGAPAGGEGPDLEAMLAEYAQTRDPQMAVAICDMLVEMVAQQGGGAGAPPAGAPMARSGAKMNTAPVFKA